jgi:hypothetical protein
MYSESRYPEDMSSGHGGWVLRGFERYGDALVSEHPLTGVDADALATFIREILNRPEDDPLYFCHPLTPEVAYALLERVGVEAELDSSREEYFLEFDA